MVHYDDTAWQRLQGLFLDYGLNLAAYKRSQVERRVLTFMQREGFDDVQRLLAALRADPDLYQRFHTHLTIHVTEFFRDRPYWTTFEQILRRAAQSYWAVWSAGCSWGAEAVTMALILEHVGKRYTIWATDSDETVLEQARRGRYAPQAVEKVPPVYRRYLRCDETEGWRVEPGVWQHLRFDQHDLVSDPVPGRYHVVLCRNLLIYFERDVRWALLRKLADALEPGGYLLLGATETFLEAGDFGFQVMAPSLYQKRAR
jgi:chemotaxis protein methyltransferase CheR